MRRGDGIGVMGGKCGEGWRDGGSVEGGMCGVLRGVMMPLRVVEGVRGESAGIQLQIC